MFRGILNKLTADTEIVFTDRAVDFLITPRMHLMDLLRDNMHALISLCYRVSWFATVQRPDRSLRK
jgi:hypothetical protein